MVGVVDEDLFFALVWVDEPVALLSAEPLYRALTTPIPSRCFILCLGYTSYRT